MAQFKIETKDASKAIGSYSQGITANKFLFISGKLPIDPVPGKISDGPIVQNAHIVLKNFSAIVQAIGTQLGNTVKTILFPTVNDVYSTCFNKPFPARSAVRVAAPSLGVDIEMEAIFTLS